MVLRPRQQAQQQNTLRPTEMENARLKEQSRRRTHTMSDDVKCLRLSCTESTVNSSPSERPYPSIATHHVCKRVLKVLTSRKTLQRVHRQCTAWPIVAIRPFIVNTRLIAHLRDPSVLTVSLPNGMVVSSKAGAVLSIFSNALQSRCFDDACI